MLHCLLAHDPDGHWFTWGLVGTAFILVMHGAGFLTLVHAVMSTRTAQGAIAWALSAITFPYLAVPAYWVLGRSRFDGYELPRFSHQLQRSVAAIRAQQLLQEQHLLVEPETPRQRNHMNLLDSISKLPLTRGNDATLLVDGKQTFGAILPRIAQAKKYVLVQFYIFRDDGLGRDLQAVLIERAQAGVPVFVLYDELGSGNLPRAYVQKMAAAGVQVHPFNTTQGKGNRFRLNFRNHRKIVVVDGEEAFVGGHNVGDEYLGKHPKLSPWRDTHVSLRGPVVQFVQVPFVEDWNWATGSVVVGPHDWATPSTRNLLGLLDWEPQPAPQGDMIAACVPTGPADVLETGTLWFLQQINSARDRLWIVSPYFIPDEQLMSALQLASLRGVDVKIIIPQNADHLHVYLSSLSYLEEAERAGIEIWRYQPGFLHQKVVLIDDVAASVGTANLDNRSMRLNFEITMLLIDSDFATQVEAMLRRDLEQSVRATPGEYTERSLPYRFLVRTCRLLAPLQ